MANKIPTAFKMQTVFRGMWGAGGVSEFVRKLRGWRFALLSMVAGASYAFAFAPFNIFPLIFVVFPLILLAIDHSKTVVTAFRFGWFFGFGHFLAANYWIGLSFLAQESLPVWPAPLVVATLAGILALYTGLTFGLARMFWPSGWRRIFVLAVIWTIFEWLRGVLFTGFPWNQTANIWAGSDAMIQSVAYIGSHGLGFFTILIGASFVLLIEGGVQNRIRIPALALAGFFLLFGLGQIRLLIAEPIFHGGVKIRLIQANIAQKDKWAPDKKLENFEKYLEMSRRASEYAGDITHVIWPETALTYRPDNKSIEKELQILAAEENISIITGAARVDLTSDGLRVFNSIYQMTPEGELSPFYDKSHLVPFGEYLPFRSFFRKLGLDKIVSGDLDYSAGAGRATVFLPGLPSFSPLICYEIIFSGEVTGTPRPQWILNITNDGWFGQSSGPYQHLAMAKFRAVEEGLPVVRSAATGISAVIDSHGRIVKKLDLGMSGVLDSALPRELTESTFYSRFGGRIYLLLLLAGLILGYGKKRR